MKPNCNPFFSFIFSFLHFTIHMNWMSLVDVTSSSSSSNTQNNTTEFPFRQDNYRFEMNSIALAFIYVCQDAMRIRYAKCHLRVGTFACEVREWKWWNIETNQDSNTSHDDFVCVKHTVMKRYCSAWLSGSFVLIERSRDQGVTVIKSWVCFFPTHVFWISIENATAILTYDR